MAGQVSERITAAAIAHVGLGRARSVSRGAITAIALSLVTLAGLGAFSARRDDLGGLPRQPLWALALPLIATLYLAMTWTSALRYYRRTRARWKDRVYEVGA